MKKMLHILLVSVLFLPLLLAQESKPPVPPGTQTPTALDKDRPRPIKDVLPNAKKIDGLLTFYQKKDKLYAEIKGNNLNTDYLIAMAIAKGSGWNAVGGYTLQSNGGDWLWQFRKVNDNIQVVRRNIRFKADSGTPESQAVEVGYSDSILYSLPIIATGDSGGDVIDLASIFMADLPKLGIGSFDRSRSTWGDVKGFANNMEFRVAATYSGYSRFGGIGLAFGGDNSSPDPNAIGVTLHYSISKLPSTGYRPRLADHRVGYFTVSHKNFSRAAEDNHMVRYITRWNLQKADSSASLSPPKKPLVFWIENTVPFKYRNAVREGILEWNKAFEKIGIVNAIEVRQQADTDTWDSEDINYNTIRWITSDAGFAMGPSRVNPMTGEILDADIIIDAGFIDSWQEGFDFTIADVLPLERSQRSAEPFTQRKIQPTPMRQKDEDYYRDTVNSSREYAQARASHFALASLALALNDGDDDGEPKEEDNSEKVEEDKKSEEEAQKENDIKEVVKEGEEPKEDPKEDDGEEKNGDAKEGNKEDKDKEEGDKEDKDKEDKDKKEEKKEKKPSRQELEKERNEKFNRLVLAGIKDLVTHEVGHTLGLRHNFQASSWLTLDEINDPKRSQEFGHAGSVMDYLTINIAPKGKPQGDYFMSRLGPYDYLAIEYGYKPLSGSTEGEKKDLAKIASRQAEKGNNYAPDEELMFGDSVDPRTGVYDLGTDPMAFSQQRLELYNQLLPEILNRAIKEDGKYRDVGRYFLLLVNLRYWANNLLMRNIEGLYRNRDYKGDSGDRLPIVVVDAKTKRESVQFLCDNTFGADAFKVAPEIYNRFGSEKWLSEGDDSIERTVPISLGDLMAEIQCYTLEDMLAPWMLDALSDTILRSSEEDDVYSIDELFSTVTASVFNELETIKEGKDFSARKPAISQQRRTLQEHYFTLLAYYASGNRGAFFRSDTNSSRALARQELRQIESKIQVVLNNKMDAGSSAHLAMLQDRIKKLLDANLTFGRP